MLRYSLVFVALPALRLDQLHVEARSMRGLSDRQAKEFESLFEYLDKQIFSGSMSVYMNGTQLVHHQMGQAFPGPSQSQQQPNNQTQFRIGSVTKPFTATMILQLIDEGKLSLETTLDNFFPNIDTAASITMEYMLRHQSGLRDFANADAAYFSYEFQPQTRQDMLERIEAYDSQFTPGSHTSYSNTNYLLLGFIVEDLSLSGSGTTAPSYEEALRLRISEPLNLTRTETMTEPSVEENVAFSFFDDKPVDPSTHVTIPGGAGHIMATAADVTNFLLGLLESKRLVSEPLLTRMVEQDKETWGMGLIGYQFDEERGLGHTGAIDAFHSIALYFPSSSIALCVLANSHDSKLDNADIAYTLYRIALGKEYELPSPVEEEDGIWLIITIVVCAVVLVLTACVCWCRRRRHALKSSETETTS